MSKKLTQNFSYIQNLLIIEGTGTKYFLIWSAWTEVPYKTLKQDTKSFYGLITAFKNYWKFPSNFIKNREIFLDKKQQGTSLQVLKRMSNGYLRHLMPVWNLCLWVMSIFRHLNFCFEIKGIFLKHPVLALPAYQDMIFWLRLSRNDIGFHFGTF